MWKAGTALLWGVWDLGARAREVSGVILKGRTDGSDGSNHSVLGNILGKKIQRNEKYFLEALQTILDDVIGSLEHSLQIVSECLKTINFFLLFQSLRKVLESMRGRIFPSAAWNIFIFISLMWNVDVLMLTAVFLKDIQIKVQNTHKPDAPPSAVVQNPRVRLLISPVPERGGLAFEVRFHSSTVAIEVLSLCGRICQFM